MSQCDCPECRARARVFAALDRGEMKALLREAADALDAAMAHTCGLAGRERCALCQLLRRLREAAK